ncbi:T-cell immunomodulatory protein-like [Mya arenaria]|uniref:T-cell immunomodulatory protein-like n=1 Tax=Mya arenaria TaxID=6604 RepID=UPI0022E1C975|nr:T-cell immunomodulatory protein-like [Mya arenaria]
MTQIYFFLLVFLLIKCCLTLEDVTDKIFGSKPHGFISAFGDFNADKYTDIFVISETGNAVELYLADNDKEFTQKTLLDNSTFKSSISSVVPADFDGDLQMDVLVTFNEKEDDRSFVTGRIYWGDGGSLSKDENLQLSKMTDQPLVMDYNADMIPDLFGESADGTRQFWIMSGSRNVTVVKMALPEGKEKFDPLWSPQTSAFLDINNDLTADMMVVSQAGGIPQLEYWINKNGVLTWDGKTIPVKIEGKEIQVYGQITFVDLDGDLRVDPLIPVCEDKDCSNSLLLVYNGEKWVNLPLGLDYSGVKWNFLPPGKSGAPSFITVPPTLRVGDFNLDSHPDLIAVLGNATENLHRAVLLYNKDCEGDCGGFSRRFEIRWDTWLESHDVRALLPAFYDVRDSGILDIIVTALDSKDSPVIQIRKQDFVDDACFVKVTVVSGRCDYDCPGDRKPYGVNQPGPTIRYKTLDVKGDTQQKVAFQLSQSAYLPLQLPYTVFGLGQTPNFVDSLWVGIPTNTSSALNREWQSVIPNSQLLIIPHPIHDPSGWTSKLFVMPSRLMLLTGAALLGTCGFIAGLVAVLHWRDKVEDKKEKRQEAQKFHFDAM